MKRKKRKPGAVKRKGKKDRKMKEKNLLNIVESVGADFSHIRLEVLRQNQEGKIRNPRHLWCEHAEHEFYDDMLITCQFHKGSKDCYGFEVRFCDVYVVDLNKAGLMYKTLKRIQSRLKKIEDSRGPVVDFAEYAGRVSEIIGADFARIIGEANGWHDNNTYEIMNRAQGVSAIRFLQNQIAGKMVES